MIYIYVYINSLRSIPKEKHVNLQAIPVISFRVVETFPILPV